MTYSNRGFAYYNQEEYEKAIVDYSKSIELDPTDAGVYSLRGLAYELLGDEKKAAADSAKAKELGFEP